MMLPVAKEACVLFGTRPKKPSINSMVNKAINP